jgi:alkanesulfonate monooxygenase SsuD/methylene tetrahydromethanopterin reductase-like flavin-dependent oxidoreductase (luciferase family)
MSELGRVGIWSMELRLGSAEGARQAATELDGLGYPALWIPGLSGQGAMTRVEELLAATKRATIATGVLGLWSQEPGQLASTHHQLTEAYGPRVMTGIGVSDAASAHSAGAVYPGAVTAMNDYLDRLDTHRRPDPDRPANPGGAGSEDDRAGCASGTRVPSVSG